MSAPCQAVTECGVPTTPGIGYSSETSVAPSFVATATGPNAPPPLGWAFLNAVATSPGESTVSEAESELNAWLAASSSAAATWSPPSQAVTFDEFSWNEDTWDAPVTPIF
jgi:hypothetical protein